MFRARSRPRGGRDVRFLWQVLLVVPPVVLLSAMALYSLRQDRSSIEQDARRNAGVLAEDLARRVGDRIHGDVAAAAVARTSASQPLCGLILDGRIRLPVDYPALPSPPSWPYALTGGEARAWSVAAAATPESDLLAARRAVATLAGAPLPVRANAEWALLRAEVARGDAARAGQRLAELAARYPDVLSESGTPLGDLALLLALRHSPAGSLPDPLVRGLRTRILERPSFMTPALVEEAERRAAGDGAAALGVRWRANERALDLLRRLPADSLQPGEFVLEEGSEAWLALVAPLAPLSPLAATTPRTAFHVTLVPAPLIQRAFRAALSVVADQVPGYASVYLGLGDRLWRAGETAPAGGRLDELASAAGRFELRLWVPADAVPTFREDLLRAVPEVFRSVSTLADGPLELAASPVGHTFTVGVDLVSPDVLYASYRRRFWLAMGLILTATVAAFAGLASTWQAFQRQRRLGEMKSNFVASVSHELRAPIAAVTLMTESLERGTIEDGNRRQEYLRTIVQECRRLASLVDNVLDFSRIDQGRASYTFEPADVGALVAQTVDLMRPYGAQRQIGLVHAPPPQDGDRGLQLEVDRQALQQALVNLIDNAIKHSPSGAQVTVGVERVRDQLCVFVEDLGPGIPVGEQERIFEPFYRRGSELRRETRGIGIGLSIVKHIAEAHGGRVVVRSTPGEGSRFAIELPFSREPRP